jgi:hypothetical protein
MYVTAHLEREEETFFSLHRRVIAPIGIEHEYKKYKQVKGPADDLPLILDFKGE